MAKKKSKLVFSKPKKRTTPLRLKVEFAEMGVYHIKNPTPEDIEKARKKIIAMDEIGVGGGTLKITNPKGKVIFNKSYDGENAHRAFQDEIGLTEAPKKLTKKQEKQLNKELEDAHKELEKLNGKKIGQMANELFLNGQVEIKTK